MATEFGPSFEFPKKLLKKDSLGICVIQIYLGHNGKSYTQNKLTKTSWIKFILFIASSKLKSFKSNHMYMNVEIDMSIALSLQWLCFEVHLFYSNTCMFIFFACHKTKLDVCSCSRPCPRFQDALIGPRSIWSVGETRMNRCTLRLWLYRDRGDKIRDRLQNHIGTFISNKLVSRSIIPIEWRKLLQTTHGWALTKISISSDCTCASFASYSLIRLEVDFIEILLVSLVDMEHQWQVFFFIRSTTYKKILKHTVIVIISIICTNVLDKMQFKWISPVSATYFAVKETEQNSN